jgi:hypothetical protein
MSYAWDPPPPFPFHHIPRLPKALTRRMLLNLAISAVIGIVPIVGDVILASYRVNVRNARLLENFLLLRSERVAKDGGIGARALSEKNHGGADGDEGEGQRGAAERWITKDKAPEKTIVSPTSLSQPGAAVDAARSSDGDKTTLVPSTEGDDKDKGVAAAAPVPDDADGSTMIPIPRPPPRNALDLLQHRDSRFIEDVT